MDADAKSTVSSFYGGRKNSLNVFNSLPSPAANPATAHRDDDSSFVNPDQEIHVSGDGNTSAGYNRMSFFHAGREEPLKGGHDEEEDGLPAFNVYADFNNAGPRYSAAFVQNTNGYQQLKQPSTPKVDDTPSVGAVEMVTVPALGPEWKLSEMRDMTKAAKREEKAAARMEAWKQWKRDQRGFCGGWLTRRVFVFGLFALCAGVGVILAFTLPRVPSFAFNSNTPLSAATGTFADSIPVMFSRFPANFTFPAYAELQVYDLDSNRQVASGNLGEKTVPAKSFPFIKMPLNFTYVASNDTDQTWKNWYDACKNKALYADGNRPPLRFNLILEADIQGLPGQHSASAQVTTAPCPVQLPQNSI